MDSKLLVAALETKEIVEVARTIHEATQTRPELAAALGEAGLVLAETETAVETQQETPEPTPEPPHPTPEQQAAATKWTTTLAEKYGVDEAGFQVLSDRNPETDQPEVFLAYTADQGIDLGNPKKAYDKKRSWNTIKPGQPNQDFAVTVDDDTKDLRHDVTIDRLRAIAQANPKISEYNWETGAPDKADGLGAPIVLLNEGDAYEDRDPRDDDDGGVLFRPVVVL